MREWGRPPIGKAFRPDHELGICSTHNLVEEGKKASSVGGGRPAKSEEMRVEALGSEEGLKEESEL